MAISILDKPKAVASPLLLEARMKSVLTFLNGVVLTFLNGVKTDLSHTFVDSGSSGGSQDFLPAWANMVYQIFFFINNNKWKKNY